MSVPDHLIEAQRLESLRLIRQRIVELQAVRTYMSEASCPAPLVANVESLLHQALAVEKSLMVRKSKLARSRRGGRPPVLGALLVLGLLAEDGAGSALELALRAAAL